MQKSKIIQKAIGLSIGTHTPDNGIYSMTPIPLLVNERMKSAALPHDHQARPCANTVFPSLHCYKYAKDCKDFHFSFTNTEACSSH